MAVVTQETLDLLAEIRKDEKAWQRLRDKAQWERMSLTAILREWGDPRKWKL